MAGTGGRRSGTRTTTKPLNAKQKAKTQQQQQAPQTQQEIPIPAEPETIGSIIEQYERHTLQACKNYAKAVENVTAKMAAGSYVEQSHLQQILSLGEHVSDLAYLIPQLKFKSPEKFVPCDSSDDPSLKENSEPVATE
jgi:hypothetical protein